MKKNWDCHSHLSFLDPVEACKIIESESACIWIQGGYQPSEWESQVDLKNQYPDQIKTCYGLHPWYVKSDQFELKRDMESLKIWLEQADFLGEVGLDFYGDKSLLKKELQMHVFEEQLDLATQHPVVLHVVQAHGAALNILKDFSLKGFVHNFTGSIEVAEQYLDQGILLSFGTSLLKEHFKNAQESFRKLPLEAILLESDSPSDPLDTSDPVEIYNQVIHRAAEIKALSEEEVREQISKNILSLQNS